MSKKSIDQICRATIIRDVGGYRGELHLALRWDDDLLINVQHICTTEVHRTEGDVRSEIEQIASAYWGSPDDLVWS